jgi:hypothetical protein
VVIACSTHRDAIVQHGFDRELTQPSFQLERVLIVSRALQDLEQDEIADQYCVVRRSNRGEFVD